LYVVVVLSTMLPPFSVLVGGCTRESCPIVDVAVGRYAA
jgi:hypothetical protein